MKKSGLTLLLLLWTLLAMAQSRYKNLVFEGGGIRGVAYAGALSALAERDVLRDIERVAGTSAGSIIGLMVCLGYTPEAVDSIMTNLKIEQFNDGKGGLIGKYTRVKKFYGIHRGHVFEEWVAALVKNKTGLPNCSFAQLDSLAGINTRFKRFYCVGTNLTKQQAEVFSHEKTPRMMLKTAVRISCAIPLFYEPVLLDSTGAVVTKPVKDTRYQVYVDGGIMANYPINLFDSCHNGGDPLFCEPVTHNYATLGLKLDRREQVEQLASNTTTIPPFTIQSLNDYISAFMNLMMETMNRKPGLENEKNRTIYIGYGNILSKPRKMKAEEKKELYDSGQAAVAQYFINQQMTQHGQ
jgi:NTE family protein